MVKRVGVLASKELVAACGDELKASAHTLGLELEFIGLPENGPRERLSNDACQRIKIAYLTRDWKNSRDNYYPKFCDTVLAAKNLEWVHFTSVGLDEHKFIPELVGRGVKLTTSAGVNADPIAHTAITGLLMLARKFPQLLDAQRRRAWEPLRGQNVPIDLPGQTVAIVGLGAIGSRIANLCKSLGLNVIGVRRTPRQPGDELGEIYHPSRLGEILPRCHWLILCCAYNRDSHHLIDGEVIAKLPRGAKIINISRGAVVDEPALISALKGGHLGGAYLDVFEQEPLPSDSPLWDLPNVIITPHNASASSGNDKRSNDVFVANLALWAKGKRMRNEQS